MLNRFIYLFAMKAIVMFDLKKIIVLYFYSFLFVDLINGFLLKELSIDFPISFGQLISESFNRCHVTIDNNRDICNLNERIDDIIWENDKT